MKALALVLVAACGSSTPAPADPTPPVEPVVAPVDVAPPAEPEIPDALKAARAWSFRYATADRTEQWTLRTLDGHALVVVENAQGPRTYFGSATGDDKTIAIAVTSSTAKITLDCKKTTRAVSAKCNDAKAKKADVLDCYVPDFKEPMPFALGPGIEYVVDSTCSGYRLVR